MQPYGQPPPGYAPPPQGYGQPGYGQPAGYAQAQMPGTPNAWREGLLVVTNAGSIMVPHCLKCGQAKPDVTPRMKNFEWVPAWAKIFYIFGRLGNFIVRMLSKQATLAVSLCNECDSRWNAAKWITIGVAVGGIIGIFVLTMGLGSVAPDFAGIFFGLFFLAWIASLIALPFVVTRPRTLTPELIDGPLVKLAGAHATSIASLPGQ